MTITELIERLKKKEPDAEVEFIVVKKNGELVTADVSRQAKPIIKFLKQFN